MLLEQIEFSVGTGVDSSANEPVFLFDRRKPRNKHSAMLTGRHTQGATALMQCLLSIVNKAMQSWNCTKPPLIDARQ